MSFASLNRNRDTPKIEAVYINTSENEGHLSLDGILNVVDSVGALDADKGTE
jgi:hypothetical protein